MVTRPLALVQLLLGAVRARDKLRPHLLPVLPLVPKPLVTFEHFLIGKSPDGLLKRFDLALGANVTIRSLALRWQAVDGKRD